MKKFNLTESEKNRIRGLHFNESVNHGTTITENIGKKVMNYVDNIEGEIPTEDDYNDFIECLKTYDVNSDTVTIDEVISNGKNFVLAQTNLLSRVKSDSDDVLHDYKLKLGLLFHNMQTNNVNVREGCAWDIMNKFGLGDVPS